MHVFMEMNNLFSIAGYFFLKTLEFLYLIQFQQ